jgi:hypothetical protein
MLTKLAQYNDGISALVGIVSLIGIPIAIALFFREKRRERIEREHGTYLEVHGQYLEYLKICLDNPRARVWENETDDSSSVETTAEDLRRESIMFTYFISMAEQAFLIYRHATGKQRQRQWIGWEAYIVEYMKRAPFRNAWASLCCQFDGEFEEFMRSCEKKADQIIRQKPKA